MSDRLQEIESRLSNASAGPWRRATEAETSRTEESGIVGPGGEVMGLSEYFRIDDGDLDMIINARADLEWLVGQLKERK